MKKVLIMLLLIGLTSSGVGLGTAFGTPVLTGIKIGTGTHPDTGVDVSPDGNTYTVKGAGDDIWGTNDSFEYAFMPISGNFDISCRMVSLITSNTADGWTKAGIMVRQNINTNGASPYALIAGTAVGNPPDAGVTYSGISWQYRGITVPPATSGPLGNQAGFDYTIPVYLRLTRTGNIMNGYFSQDGVNWTWMYGNAELAGNLNLALTDPVYIGLAACPHRLDHAGALPTDPRIPDLAVAEFDTIQFNYGASVPTPAVGAAGFDYPTATSLSWEAIPYPVAPGAIKDWQVYFGSSPHDPNVTLIGTVSDPIRTITSPALDPDKTYYWRVDATNTVDSSVSRGFWWNFTTKTAKPVFPNGGQPTNVTLGLNCLATFTATAESGAYKDQGDMTFVWKKTDGTILKTEANVLTSSYSQPMVEDPNRFYVEVTNTNGTTKSNEVSLSVLVGVPQFQYTHLDNGHGIAAGTGASRSGDTYTLIGSGDDIWTNHDSCEFAFIPVSGDGVLTARVVSLTNTNNWAKVGVMFRETLAADAKGVSMVVTPPTNNRTVFQWRNATNADTVNSANDRTAAPMWVRLVRAGNTYTGYYSTDGITWNQQGDPQTFVMNKDMYIGLANTSHDTGLLCTAVFDNISSTFPVKAWEVTTPMYSAVTVEGWIDPTKVLTASWTKAAGGPCGAIYKVYGGEDPDPTKMAPYGTTLQDITQIVIPANFLPFNATIYWRVDTVFAGTTVQGTVWSFTTVQQKPIIQTQPAQLSVVNGGATVNLNVLASSATKPDFILLDKYEWFFVKAGGDIKVLADGVPIKKWTDPVDPDNPPANWGQYDCPLAIPNLQLATEGYYYCVVTNAIGSTTSAQGLALMHRLMLHYTFESAAGNVIEDQSASGFDASFVTPGGGTEPIYSLVDGGIGLGKAIRLYGQNDPNNAYITTNKKPMELGVSGKFPRTFSVWAKTSVFTESGLYDMGANADGQNFSLRTMPFTNDTWRVQFWGAGERDAVVPGSYNNWTHFVHIYDGANTILYANGKQVLNFANALNTSNANNLVLGRWSWNELLYDGLMDDFRLYNYALTPAEAVQLYLDVKPGSICYKTLAYDFNGDCEVNTADLLMFANQWLTDTLLKP